MEEERRRRRRRGRRRGRSDGQPSDRPSEEQREESQPEGAEESDKREDAPSRFRFRFGRRRDRKEEQGREEEAGAEQRRKDSEERLPGGAPTSVSPLSFWRRGRARTYREQPMPKQTMGRTLRRIRGLHFPPWVPVLFIMVMVSGILVVLFVARGAAGAPHIGQDHWHATYQVFICGDRQPNFPTWEAREGIHTHGDGIIHMHPFIPAGEGAGARLVKWFEYGGGKLTQSEMRMPGDREEFKNGQTCDDGSEAVVQVFVNGEKMDNWSRYIPQDGDQVRIVFGPDEETFVEGEGTLIPPEEADREISIEAGDRGQPAADSFFDPNAFSIAIDETVKVNVTNTGTVTHNLRVQGVDQEYDTDDDFVSEPLLITPGEEGFTVISIDQSGEYAFRCDIHPTVQFGTLTVEGELAEETPEAETEEDVDVTFDVVMGDNFFESNQLELEAGQSFRINLTNEGELAHNLRITGLDGEYDTGDDLVSTPSPLPGGGSGELVGKIDEPGVYSFRDDFHPTEAVGTITVK